jgi:hypothetical protein
MLSFVQLHFILEAIMRQQKNAESKTSSRYWDDSDWAIANAQMLSEQYPNQWVAIYNKKVIAHAKELGRVAVQAQKFGVTDPVFTFSERGIHVYRYSTPIQVSL